MFYRPHPHFSDSEQKYFTVRVHKGHITGISQVSEDAIIGGEASPPMMEEVSFVFESITWTYEENGATHYDSIH